MASLSVLGLALLLLCSLTAPLAAQTSDCAPLTLDGPAKTPEMTGWIQAQDDPDWSKTLADVTGPWADAFRPVEGSRPDFGYTPARIWLRICLRNATAQDAEWILYTHENFFQVYRAFLVPETGDPVTLIDLEQDSPFSDRPLDSPELAAPMTFPPGTTATLFINYWSGGSSQLDFSIETKDSYDQIIARKTARNFFFYGMMILLITVAFASLVVFRHPVFLAYCAYAGAALLFIMHEDGIAFQVFWPRFPAFNANASVFVGSALIVSGAVYARIFLKTRRRHPAADKVLLGVILLTLGLDAALYFTDPQLLKKLLIMMSLCAFLVFTGAGLVSYFSGYREVRFYLLAWLGVVLSSALMNLRHVVGIEISQDTVHDSMRLVMVMDALMMGLAIADRYNQLRQSRQVALEQTLDATRHRLDLNRRLTELQERHELAVELSKSRDEQIQNVVHDLRQPLLALRQSVSDLNGTRPGSPGEVQQVEAAFSYLETLIAQQLRPMPQAATKAPPAAERLERIALQDILQAVEEMFRPDATAKGLSLRLVPSRLDASVDALALTRILSNLVSNAIKYTAQGGVLIGTRKTATSVRIELHDTGPGMTEAEFALARKRTVRLEKGRTVVEGSGLDLAIAMDLAQRHGMTLSLSPMRRQGTGLVLTIPIA